MGTNYYREIMFALPEDKYKKLEKLLTNITLEDFYRKMTEIAIEQFEKDEKIRELNKTIST